VLEDALELVLVHSGTASSHDLDVSARADAVGISNHADLERRLDATALGDLAPQALAIERHSLLRDAQSMPLFDAIAL